MNEQEEQSKRDLAQAGDLVEFFICIGLQGINTISLPHTREAYSGGIVLILVVLLQRASTTSVGITKRAHLNTS